MAKLPDLKSLDLAFLKKPAPAAAPAKPASAPPAFLISPEEVDQLKTRAEAQKLQLDLMYTIIERYRKFIEDGEAKSIAELAQLVRPLDSAVTEIKIIIEDQFHPYAYDGSFLLATQKAMDIVFAWKKVKLPISFWMGFDDMVRLHAADDLDRAIFLCSLFRALGSDSAKVIIAKDKSAWVSFIFNDKDYVVNVGDKSMSAYPHDGEGIKQFLYNALYSFNDKEYQDFSQ